MTFTLGWQVTDGDQGHFGLECRLTGRAAGPRLARLHQPRDVRRPARRRGRRLRPRGPRRRPRRPRPHPRHRPAAATHRGGHPRRGPHAGDLHLGPGHPRAVRLRHRHLLRRDHPDPAGRHRCGDAPIRLNSSEAGSAFECTDNDQPVACTGGRWELPDPTAGRHRFSARTIDAAGNASAWSEPIEFFVPRNLTRQRGWAKVTGPGYFRGDAIKASRRGARLVLPRTTGRRAPAARRHRPRPRQGARTRRPARLARRGPRRSEGVAEAARRHRPLLRHAHRTDRHRVAEARPVVLDAVVARPNRFPAASPRSGRR